MLVFTISFQSMFFRMRTRLNISCQQDIFPLFRNTTDESVLKRLSMMIIYLIRTLALLIIVCNLVTGVVEAIGYFRGLKRLVNVRFNSPMKNDRKCHLRHVYFELLCHSTVKS